MKSQVKYRIYPSLLDMFQRYLDLDYENHWLLCNDGTWRKNYNESTGEYWLTPDELEEHVRKELILAINRESGEISRAADKGSVFNEILDCIILKKKATRSDISITSSSTFEYGGNTFNHPCIKGVMDGFEFIFDSSFCKDAANYFKGSLCQVYTDGLISTKYGGVKLYGYVDYLREDKVYDAKTTKRYEFGKFKDSWQKHVYPYTLIQSGRCTDIQSFEYSVFKLTDDTGNNPLITGELFPEVYTYDHDQSECKIRGIVEHFVEFLEDNREFITDKKIFNE